MALPINISLYIQYGEVSSYLAAQDFSQQNLFKGGSFRTDLPMRLNVCTRLLKWAYGRNPNDEILVNVANYLYQLCSKYIQKAKQIIANNMQGIIVNPATGVQSTLQPVYLQFRVGVTASPVVVNGANVVLPINGGSSVVLPLTYILNSLEVTLDGVEVPQSDPLQLSVNVIYTNNNATVTIANGGVFHNNDLWIISGYQYVAI